MEPNSFFGLIEKRFIQKLMFMNFKLNQAIDGRKIKRTLTIDENFNFRAAHWADLHGLLYKALVGDIFFWGHFFLSFSFSVDKSLCESKKAKFLKQGKS